MKLQELPSACNAEGTGAALRIAGFSGNGHERRLTGLAPFGSLPLLEDAPCVEGANE